MSELPKSAWAIVLSPGRARGGGCDAARVDGLRRASGDGSLSVRAAARPRDHRLQRESTATSDKRSTSQKPPPTSGCHRCWGGAGDGSRTRVLSLGNELWVVSRHARSTLVLVTPSIECALALVGSRRCASVVAQQWHECNPALPTTAAIGHIEPTGIDQDARSAVTTLHDPTPDLRDTLLG